MKNTKKGFTLVELLVVIAILAILATVSIVGYTSFINRANDSTAQQELTQIRDYYVVSKYTGGVVVNQSLVEDIGLKGTIEKGVANGKECYKYTVNKGTAYWFIGSGEVTVGVNGWLGETPVNKFAGKVISIMGDSISTFDGYTPVADGFNLEHRDRYPQSNLLTDVNETWWMQVLTELDAKLGINDSWAGSRVINTSNVSVSGDQGIDACMASLTRIQNLGSNGTPDIILFYGGTNDISANITVGTFNPATAPTTVDLTSVKWSTFADAYVAAIMRMQYYYPDAEIIAMFPTYTSNNNHAKIENYNSVLAAICNHYGVTYTDLRDCGITTADLPDGTHPDAKGMDYITEAVLEALRGNSELKAGENVVHSVTHNLSNASSSLSYYKGVSHGKSFTTNVTGQNISVTVTMGGVDITASSYANGVINIANVTGDIVIKVTGESTPNNPNNPSAPNLTGLQYIPESATSETNLWTALNPIKGYYTGDGLWGTNAEVYSVTIPVSAGYMINATSFGSTSGGNGIRITYFKADGTKLKGLSPAEVYAEYTANGGYIVVPEGAAYINIPMWAPSDSNAIYIMNLAKIPCPPELQELPEGLTSTTNLWTALTPDAGYYTSNGIFESSGTNANTIPSITIPVSAGQKINAYSFGAKNANGNTANNGIRITYFKADGTILKSLSPVELYTEYTNNGGYIVVPEGAFAVNIPMWTESANNYVYILNP